ncbi:MAG TPA: carbohydrate ABC transporter permease [Clostridia bacterium]|nr:carbohydrate ABC transporter permease [Clostridia bacterium]
MHGKPMTTRPLGRAIRDSAEDKVLYAVVNTLLALFTLVVAYPIVYVISSSFSTPQAVSMGRVVLWPVGLSVEGYKAVFSHRYIVSAYRNTLFYTTAGTLINLFVTMTCAYPLSRRDFPMKGFFTGLFLLTMFFGGGLIPTYILMTKLGFINKVWAMLIPGALSVYNMILVRTFLSSSIPLELLEASQIDGCSDAMYFLRIALPLAKPVIAVITLYYAVGHWNAYFGAMIYLNDIELFPLQLILRQILVANQINLEDLVDVESLVAKQGLADLLKYALIVVSTAPIMCVYPFIQRYFVKGVMIGSVKG